MTMFATALAEALGDESQESFGARVGTTQQTVGRWLAGTAMPRPEMVVRVAQALNDKPEKWLRLRDQSTIAQAVAKPRPPTRAELDRVARRAEKLTQEVAELQRRLGQ